MKPDFDDAKEVIVFLLEAFLLVPLKEERHILICTASD